MTTIATDGRSMAGDGITLTANEIVANHTATKVQRLSDGSLLGCAGSTAVKHRIRDWLEAQLAGKSPPFPSIKGPFSVIWLRRDGTARYFNEDGRENWSALGFPFAIGSGAELAMGAMAARKSPREAVEIASRHDPYTGGVIIELALEETP